MAALGPGPQRWLLQDPGYDRQLSSVVGVSLHISLGSRLGSCFSESQAAHVHLRNSRKTELPGVSGHFLTGGWASADTLRGSLCIVATGVETMQSTGLGRSIHAQWQGASGDSDGPCGRNRVVVDTIKMRSYKIMSQKWQHEECFLKCPLEVTRN